MNNMKVRSLMALMLAGALAAPVNGQVNIGSVKKKLGKPKEEAAAPTAPAAAEAKPKESSGGADPLQGQLDGIPSEGMTGPYHEAHKGQVVFATASVPRSEPESVGIRAAFNSTETIYARVYLDRALAQFAVCTDKGNCFANTEQSSSGIKASPYFAMLQVDGDATGIWLAGKPLPPDEKGNFLTTFQFPIIGAPGKDGTREETAAMINKLSPGAHQCKVVVWAGNVSMRKSKEPIAIGEFTFEKKAGDIKLGRAFSDLKPGKKDPALEKSLLSAIQTKAKADGWKEQFSRVIISGEDWTVQKNQYTGITLGRTISAWALAKWPDGHCTYQDFSFYEEYVGTTFSGKVTWHGTGDQTSCDCQ